MTPYSSAYRRLVVLLLASAYTFNSMDRSIISILGPSIKADLKLTDTQLGLLGGSAFAVLYGLGGLPIARLAERVSRVNIMTVALLVWSGLTALCATAASFGQLLLIRVGVGVAEAGCSPPAHSLISDYVEPARRASALSVYTCGISIGYILAAGVGGYIAQQAGWRTACAAAGLPGVLTALLIKMLVREPVAAALLKITDLLLELDRLTINQFPFLFSLGFPLAEFHENGLQAVVVTPTLPNVIKQARDVIFIPSISALVAGPNKAAAYIFGEFVSEGVGTNYARCGFSC